MLCNFLTIWRCVTKVKRAWKKTIVTGGLYQSCTRGTFHFGKAEVGGEALCTLAPLHFALWTLALVSAAFHLIAFGSHFALLGGSHFELCTSRWHFALVLPAFIWSLRPPTSLLPWSNMLRHFATLNFALCTSRWHFAVSSYLYLFFAAPICFSKVQCSLQCTLQ